MKKKYTKFEKALLDPSKKWVYYTGLKKISSDSVQFLTYMKFKKDNEYFNYYINEDSQYGSAEYWNYSNSNKELQLITFKFIVTQTYEDSIILKNKEDNHVVKLFNHNVLHD